jgi:para-nitrobenzyl esterase
MSVALLTAPRPAVAADRVVRIDSGALSGVLSHGVVSFKGIPYAAPPVGDLRWRPPRRVESWTGVRRATVFGHDCVQKPIPGDAGASGAERGEDCLVLNVWTPSRFGPGRKLPVMVWIHGGGFLNGAASVPFFDGGEFAREGVVLVSFNYRLGRLGFFAHPALTAEGERPLANYALLDQLAALRWVQRNIAAFGGDLNQVTVVGESAGGISVVQLLTWPAARGLFQRAAVLSGGGRSFLMPLRRLSEPAGSLPSAEASGLEFGRSVGITDTGADGLRALRALPAEAVNGDLSMAALVEAPPTYTGGPVEDGEVITARPEKHFLRGGFAKVPLLLGTTGDDLPLEFPPDRTRPLDVFGADAERARSLYDPKTELTLGALAARVAVDITMHEPARFLAREMSAAGQPAWLYRFDYVAQSQRAKVASAPHAGELGFLFDQLKARYGKAANAKDQAVAKTFHTYFLNFAKFGDPNGPGLPEWPRFDPSKFDLMLIDGSGEARMRPDPLSARIALVERAMDARAAATP